jgi:hypothetical protein
VTTMTTMTIRLPDKCAPSDREHGPVHLRRKSGTPSMRPLSLSRSLSLSLSLSFSRSRSRCLSRSRLRSRSSRRGRLLLVPLASAGKIR